MYDKPLLDTIKQQARTTVVAQNGDQDLGALNLLPGLWKNLPGLPGRGWNMIALPFAATPPAPNYRLLLNQYNEVLRFSLVSKAVPNRGVTKNGTTVVEADQFLVALDYEQSIAQVDAADFPDSGLAGGPGAAIHLEPGLWLQMANEAMDGVDIARLGTIPHGDSVLALGNSQILNGAPVIGDINSLPEGVAQSLTNPYLAPYLHFHEHPFKDQFDPTLPNALLREANNGVRIARTTVLSVDTAISTGGIVNIPFLQKQANPVSMRSTFWISELEEKDLNGKPKLRLQYSQVVMLNFFDRTDGLPGLISWPHVSINTMEKVPDGVTP